jgi:hypothetical protein
MTPDELTSATTKSPFGPKMRPTDLNLRIRSDKSAGCQIDCESSQLY